MLKLSSYYKGFSGYSGISGTSGSAVIAGWSRDSINGTTYTTTFTDNVNIGTDTTSDFKLNVVGNAKFVDELYVDSSLYPGETVGLKNYNTYWGLDSHLDFHITCLDNYQIHLNNPIYISEGVIGPKIYFWDTSYGIDVDAFTLKIYADKYLHLGVDTNKSLLILDGNAAVPTLKIDPGRFIMNNVSTSDWAPCLDILTPNIADGLNSALIRFGHSTGTGNCGQLSFTGNAVAGLESIKFSIYGKDNLLQLNGEGNLLVKASTYLNYGTTVGISGYGIRDNSGILEFKNSGGSWNNINSIVDLGSITSEPTGFVNQTDSTLSFTNTTPDRTFTISGTFDYYIKGTKYSKTSVTETVQITAVEGIHHIYYNGSTLTATQGAFTSAYVKDYVYIASLYWDNTNSVVIFICDERHSVVMDWQTHLYLHQFVGTQLLSGGGLTNLVVDGNGSLATHCQFGVDTATINDEDIQIVSSTKTNPASIPIFYRLGTTWRVKTADAYPIIYNGTAGWSNTLPAWNDYNGGTWRLWTMTNNDLFYVHYFVTNDIVDANRIIGILGQSVYTTVNSARTAAQNELSNLVTTGMPMVEFKPIASVLFECSSNYANTPKARIRSINTTNNYIDWRFSKILPASSTSSVINHFTSLVDVPNTYASQSGKSLRVNTGETSLEFYTPSLTTTFTSLTDCPASYTGQELKGVRVNAGATGLEFYTSSTDAGWTRVSGAIYPTTATDNVGINNSAPDYKLDVAGDIRVQGTNTLRFAGTTSSDSKFSIVYNSSSETLDINYLG